MKSDTPKDRDYSKCVHVHKRTGGQKICQKARTHEIDVLHRNPNRLIKNGESMPSLRFVEERWKFFDFQKQPLEDVIQNRFS